jgi:hypothetical protein
VQRLLRPLQEAAEAIRAALVESARAAARQEAAVKAKAKPAGRRRPA